MEKNETKLTTAFSDDLLGNNTAGESESSAHDAAELNSRLPRRDEYHEGFILRGDCL